MSVGRLFSLPDERAADAGVAEDDEHAERGLHDREDPEVERPEQPRQRNRAGEHDELVDHRPRRQRGDRVSYRAPEAVEIDVAHSASRKRSHCGRVPMVTRTMPASCGRSDRLRMKMPARLS